MKSTRATSLPHKESPIARPAYSLFNKTNLLWMVAGAVVIIIGFVLMSGGRSDDANVFNDNEVYSATRITVAPVLILGGLVILIFSLFRNQKAGS